MSDKEKIIRMICSDCGGKLPAIPCKDKVTGDFLCNTCYAKKLPEPDANKFKAQLRWNKIR